MLEEGRQMVSGIELSLVKTEHNQAVILMALCFYIHTIHSIEHL